MRLPLIFTYGLPVLLIAVGIAAELVTLKPSTIRTELRFGKSLRPQDEQEISVTGTNGSSVNIIVKKHDPNQASTWTPNGEITYNPTHPDSVSRLEIPFDGVQIIPYEKDSKLKIDPK